MEKLSKPAAVIFDMDGTIIDSEGFAKDIWSKAGISLGFEIPDSLLNSMIGSSVSKTNELYLNYFGQDFPIDKLRDKKTEIELASYGKGLLKEKDGASNLINFLKDKKVPLGLGTSTERYRAEKRLNEAGFLGVFDYMLFGDEVENQKPNPEVYLRVAKALNAPIQNCLIVEDSSSGVGAGVASGAQVVWIKDINEISDELKSQVIQLGSLEELRNILYKFYS